MYNFLKNVNDQSYFQHDVRSFLTMFECLSVIMISQGCFPISLKTSYTKSTSNSQTVR